MVQRWSNQFRATCAVQLGEPVHAAFSGILHKLLSQAELLSYQLKLIDKDCEQVRNFNKKHLSILRDRGKKPPIIYHFFKMKI